ncbi:MAG: hypothetical protein EPN21_07860 [Methylococcaceae bacterium]|nr:MAG: hypothetical protein EPN21_07860 [Methylococcaceae bacterium]
MFTHEKLPDGSVQFTIPAGSLPALVIVEFDDKPADESEHRVAKVFRVTDQCGAFHGVIEPHNKKRFTGGVRAPGDGVLCLLWRDAVEIAKAGGAPVADVMASLVDAFQQHFGGKRVSNFHTAGAPNDAPKRWLDLSIEVFK